MDAWTFSYEGFEPERERLREALCTLANGRFATRGAFAEADADDVHYPGTYVAGGYDRLATEIAGRTVENEDLVNFPNWLPLTYRAADGPWFNHRVVEVRDFRQVLDLRRGLLQRTFVYEDQAGRRTRVAHRRFVSLADPFLAAEETTLVPENWAGTLGIRSALDGRVVNDNVERYRALNRSHLRVLERSAQGDTLLLKVQTMQSELRVAQAARTVVHLEGQDAAPSPCPVEEDALVAHEYTLDVHEGKAVRVAKTVSLATSRDAAVSEPGLRARAALADAPDFDALLDRHVREWEALWGLFDVEVDVAPTPEGVEVQRILRLHVFHVLQTTGLHHAPADRGIPARGWHGEAYRGHVFWDELFVFPLLLHRLPHVARDLLLYRFRRLDAARRAARAVGLRGAMYPWQSGSDGREESQTVHLNPRSGRWIPDHSRLQRHVGSAVVYNVWKYYEATGDHAFMAVYGAEMIIEVARFWASLARHNAKDDRYEIDGVMGPDEYHDAYPDADEPGLRNNTYTNVMAAWVLQRAVEVLQRLNGFQREQLRARLGVTAAEVEGWTRIGTRMRVVTHDGILSQFEGFQDLEEFDWVGYRAKYGSLTRLDRILEAEGDTPNRYQVCKQADVLMLFYLFSSEELWEILERLGYDLPRQVIPDTIAYYLDRTVHGSTLSRVVHSWLLNRSDPGRSWDEFHQAVLADVRDVQGGTTPEGIHLGAMAGTVDLLQRGYTGLEVRAGRLRFNPRLPRGLNGLRLTVLHAGHVVTAEVWPDRIVLTACGGPGRPVPVAVGTDERDLEPGDRQEFRT